MTHVVKIAHLRIAHQVANPEVGNPEGILSKSLQGLKYSALGHCQQDMNTSAISNQSMT